MDKQPVRLITVAWGERYIDELFSLTLPALLAPNNLPALAQNFACELVLVIEEAWFERLRQHPVYFQLRRYCTVEFRPIDDLVNQRDAYGMTLTYALFRGFEELGPAMVDRQLIFFNADFVLADGSLRTVGQKILAGERLILAPSYCVVGEMVTPWLLSRKDPEQGIIAVPAREMAATALRYRHNTIRGKTVNQRAFSAEWMDQFYWLVDENTLLGHQMPFAVVSMRPERVLTDMVTFWDYGIISEACPTTPRCVLGDSDDFLMIELRSADTARDQLRLGWPEPKQIAEKVKQFITKDPIGLARYTLTLHSADLPSGLDAAAANLDRFVEAVLAELPSEPTHWVNHPIWAYHYPRFHQARRAFLGLSAEPEAPVAGAANGAEAMPALLPEAAPGGMRGMARRLYYRSFGRAPWVRPLHPRWPDAQPVVRVLRKRPDARILVVGSERLPERLFSNVVGRHMSVAALGVRQKPSAPPVAAQAGRLRVEAEQGIEAELTLFGETKPQTLWLSVLDLAWEAAAPTSIPEPIEGVLTAAALPPDSFGLCIFELNDENLGDLPLLVDRVSPWLQSGGKILVYHLNTRGPEGARNLIAKDLLWLDRPCEIHLVGSELSFRSASAFYEGIAGLRSRRALPAARGLARIGKACISSLRARGQEPIRAGHAPAYLTSLTIEIDVCRPTDAHADDHGVLHAAE